VDDGAFGFGFFGSVGEYFEVISVAGIEHDGAFFVFAPGDLFLKPNASV
jgi:hypothetical protein